MDLDILSVKRYALCIIWMLLTNSKENEKSISVQSGQIADLQTDAVRTALRLSGWRVLTVLGVCVAERVLAVCVATVMVVDLARIRSLILFNAELMVWSRTAQRETEDDTCNESKVHLTTRQTLLHDFNNPPTIDVNLTYKTMKDRSKQL